MSTMNPANAKDRFEELDVARAMGDLSADELAEYKELQQEHGFSPDPEWGSLLSSLEVALIEKSEEVEVIEPFGEAFKQKVVGNIESIENEQQSSDDEKALAPPNENKPAHETKDSSEDKASIVSFFSHPSLGWVAAAIAILVAISVNSGQDPSGGTGGSSGGGEVAKSSEDLRNLLLSDTSSYKANFASPGEDKKPLGDGVWNSEQQSGYMKLSNIPVNDPKKSQYQLWIVDPKRDKNPVEGGVFDLASLENAIVPINAALAIDKPVAFVITEEQPGGVVVSDQKRVIAIASISP